MKKIFLLCISMVMLLSLALISCDDSEPKGACESTTPGFEMCTSDQTDGGCPNGGDWVFHEGKSCVDLGYSAACSNAPDSYCK